jgi:peptidoglycan/LPS O-acetylase OafA/YrhL
MATTTMTRQDSKPIAEDEPTAKKPPSRVVQLDWVRGLAILLVIDHHAILPASNNFLARTNQFVGEHVGWMGVDLFFVLSGFLVGGLLIQEITKSGDIQVGRFLIRRMLKIWPAYYFYILFQIITRHHPLSSFVWQNVLNIQNYAGTSLSHTWSLGVEEHFYLLLPIVLLWIYRKKPLRERLESILLGICVAVLCIRIVTYLMVGPDHLQWHTHARIDGLLYGVLLSHVLYASRERFDRLLQHRVIFAVLSVAVFVIALFTSHDSAYMSTIGYTVNSICFAALMLLVYGYHGWLNQTKLYQAMAWIGRYSYGIYLWHLSVREPLAHLGERLPLPSSMAWLVVLTAQCAAAIVLGFLLTKLVEIPALRLRDRLFPRGVAQLPPTNP